MNNDDLEKLKKKSGDIECARLESAVLTIIALSNMLSAGHLNQAAKYVSDMSYTGYYDCPDGDLLMREIAAYFKKKANQKRKRI